jgi:Protein of unknown function (DUF3311)
MRAVQHVANGRTSAQIGFTTVCRCRSDGSTFGSNKKKGSASPVWRSGSDSGKMNENPLTRPSFGALLLALIPFSALCFSVSAWDRIHPLILGLPFNLFWLLSWIVLTPLCMGAAYRIVTRPR